MRPKREIARVEILVESQLDRKGTPDRDSDCRGWSDDCFIKCRYVQENRKRCVKYSTIQYMVYLLSLLVVSLVLIDLCYKRRRRWMPLDIYFVDISMSMIYTWSCWIIKAIHNMHLYLAWMSLVSRRKQRSGSCLNNVRTYHMHK